MIHQADVSVETQWQKELKQSFTAPEELLQFLNLSPADFAKDTKARRLFPMRVPRPFANLIERQNPRDPLLLQVLPLADEFVARDGFVTDPLLEQDNQTPGLLHKYKSRVLIIFRGGCAVNCRYCFRRHFPYDENQVNKRQLLEHLEYLKQHPEINEVILSGGDPLMAKDDAITWFIEHLEQIPHLKIIRIHTRLPVVIPSRITSQLLRTLQASRLKAVMVLHINHAQEIGEALKIASQKIRQHGIWLLNQAVLLKGVNDNIETQVSLSHALLDADIQPYYLHLLDKVAGASHFYIDDSQALSLYQQMMDELPGFLLPRLVREIGGKTSKTPVLPATPDV